ncbi:hypothetical protein ACVA7E_003087 [Shigella sonnei]
MLGGADNPNGELLSYIIGADRGFVVTVWTRGGNQLRYPGKYRVVENLPDVSPWSEH